MPNPKPDSNWQAHLLRKRRKSSNSSLKKSNQTSDAPMVTKCLALDCEMVGVGRGGHRSALAQVVVTNEHLQTVYSTYVLPQEDVIDYRTQWSGVTEENLRSAKPFEEVQRHVFELIANRILVGHDIRHDFKVLGLDHPRSLIRDTSKYKFFRIGLPSGTAPKLKMLSAKFLRETIQTGEHNPAEDANAAMKLYLKYRKRWESDLKLKKTSKKETASNDVVSDKEDT
ncbi:hypothetical protein GEMRC1_014141 [Eukaryota sp. GEM-RC1]